MKVIANLGFTDNFIKGTNLVVNILQFEDNSRTRNMKIPYISASGNLNFHENPSRTLDK